MIKNLVFHIGDPKTGSSSIQKTLQSRAWSCDSVSVAPQKELNASALANSLNPQRNPKIYEKAFTKKAQWAAENDADLGIISAEFFAAVKPEALVAALQEYLPAYADSARVVAYVRPHASRFVSSYAQRVKTGTFTGGFKAFIEDRGNLKIFNYHKRFSKWHKVFGDRFVLRPFVREELRDQDVTADFLHVALRGAAFSLTPIKAANEAMTLEETAGMRVVQAVLVERKVPDYLRLSIGGAMGRELAGIPGRSRNKLALNRKNAQTILTSYLEDARRMDAEFFDGTPMEQALVDTLNKAKRSVLPVRTGAYFKQKSIQQMQGLAGELAGLVNDKPHAWRRDYRLGTGQLLHEDVAPLDEGQQENAAAVWAILRQISQILARGNADRDDGQKA